MHNPLRSEAEMFRLVVIIGTAAVPVIVLGLLGGPTWGLVVLGVELGIGIGLIWRGSRGSIPHEAEVAHDDDRVHRILVVANQTVAGRALLSEISKRAEGHETEILVVVPALPGSRLEHLAHDVDGAIAEARTRLDDSLAAMARAGLSARGEVGDHHDPNAAIEDALHGFAADEVIVSTHPPERSRWLESGVVERAESEIPLPVTHVIVDLEAEGARAA
jgi:hypothetical protein